MPMADPLELSLDTASDMASVALSREGSPLAELTWHCGRDHARQLLPAVDGLLARQDATKDDLSALFVCIGPGGYAGLRAGVSTAKGLAFGLEQPLVGVGRLEIEAYAFAGTGEPVVAVHRAGRRELAWAAYQGTSNQEPGTGAQEWREIAAPRLAPADALVDALPPGSLVTGEVDGGLAAELRERGHRLVRGAATVRRAALLAELGWRRLQAGGADDPKSLVPLYLREPAIGPQ